MEELEIAWQFTQLGCKLKGMTEIYGSGQKFMSNEYERREKWTASTITVIWGIRHV